MTEFRIEMQGGIVSEEIGKYSESKQNVPYKTIMLTAIIKKYRFKQVRTKILGNNKLRGDWS